MKTKMRIDKLRRIGELLNKEFNDLVKAVKKTKSGPVFQIGNNRGHINGWTKTVYGKATEIGGEP